MRKEILRMENVYIGDTPPFLLNNFRLNIYEGEIVNLIGLSGAGKTLLLNYFNRIVPISRGRVIYNHREFVQGEYFMPDQKVICMGQKSTLVGKMTVAENIFVLSRKKRRGLFIHSKHLQYQAKLLLSEYALDIHPNAIVDQLTPFQQHVVELLRAVVNESSLVVIDDIFQSYGYQEILMIKNLITQLQKRKIAILYESHKVDFMQSVVNRIVIMRKGMNVRTFYPREYNEELSNKLLVGNEPPKVFIRQSHCQSELILDIKNYSCGSKLKNLNLSVFKGEIIGLYDKENQCNRDLAQSLVGECHINTGNIQLRNEIYVPQNLDFAIKMNIGYIPRDMANVSLVDGMSFVENLFLPVMRKMSKLHFINDYSVLGYLSNQYMGYLGITDRDREKNVRCFDTYIHNSILLTRWILFRPTLMICIEPCAKADLLMQNIIFNALEQIAKEGSSVIISSPDLNELRPICDRIFLVKEDRLELIEEQK